MGIFSKIWKGIKKVGKKIAKGVKKTFKKIGKAIGKLGVVGQIGMMFLMPYAMGALSSFAGSALGTVGQWSANLLSKSGIGAKALGHTLNMVHKAGTFAGKVYTTISDTIGNAIDRVGNFSKGKGFTLSEGRTSIFAKGNERSLLSTEGYKLPDATTVPKPTVAPTTPEIKLDFDTVAPTTDSTGMIDINALSKDVEIQSQLAKTSADMLGTPTVETKGLLDFDAPKIEIPKIDIAGKVLDEVTPDLTLGEKIKEFATGKVQEGIETIKAYDPAKALTQGVDKIIYNKALEAGGVDTTADYIDERTVINVPEMYDVASTNPGVFKEVDFSLTKMGNAWMGSNYTNSNYINNLLGEGTSSYDSYMNQFAQSQSFQLGT
tara:strand:- start:103 stop:1233 length:1131 start_codon:yes stop_codon:yes gene_type:complete